ncbi:MULTISPECIES: GNAT family N-acetyltransferase [Bacillota]|uniref:GNAT family N-acetyltransferase n=1 Tax=Bacillota TaxID=1239 RepID=UPI001F4F15CA|nr:GNAT family N-acetyltransferase [Holdemania massiliensis]
MRNDERLRTIYEVMAPYIVRNEHNWRDYLAFASQFHKHSFDNILLVYAQDEDVSILATRKQWAAIGRNLIPRAKGVAVCVYRNAKLTLDYLFDVSQTTGKEIHPTDWQLSDEMKEALTERLSYAHGFPKQGFSQALYALASESVADNYNHFLQELKQETKGHLFTEIPAGGFEAQYIQLLTDSISYFIGKKCHLPDEEIQLSDGMATVSHFNTLPLVAHLGTAVTALSKGILLEVERNIKIINRERMAQHEQTEYQSEIQRAGRDDAARSANLQQQRSRSASGQVRPDGPGIPQRESPGAIYDFENGWQSDGDHAPGTGRGDREDRSPDPANAPAGADPADRGHHGADAPPEQSETDGGGNRTPERSPDSPLTEEHPNTEAAPSAAPVGEPSEKDGSFSVPAEQPTRHFTDAEVRRNYEYILTSTNLYPSELHSAVRSVLSEPPLNPDWSDKGRQIAALFTPYGDREYQGDLLYRTRLHGEDGISFFFDEGYTYIPWNGLAFLLDAMIEDSDYPNPVVEEQPDPIGDYNIPDEVDEMGGPHRQMTIGEADFDYVLDSVAYEAGETVVEPVKPPAIVQMENDTPAAGDEPASVPDENPHAIVEAPETALPTDTAEHPAPPPVKGNTTAHTNFRRFQELFPEIVSGQYEYLRLEAGEAYYPLVIHHKYGSHYCMEHYYMQNGDRMYDPYMDFQIDKEAGTLRAFSYENSGIGVYNEADPDDPAHEKKINGFNKFFATWLNNIRSQGYEPVRASMMVNDEEVDVDLRPAAEAVPVVEEEQPEQLSLLSLEKSTEDLLVERVMQKGPLTAGKKEQIYEFAQTHPTGSEFTAFLKKLYGYEGFSGDEMGVKYAMFNSEGVTIEWQDKQGETQETKLSWARAAGVVQRLVDEGRYLETPVVSQTEQQNEVQPFSDQYRLLDRLCADCEYFLGAGQRAEKHLWAGSVDAQIEKMRELYAQLPEKPDWISLDVINAYARRMAAPEPVENTAEASPEETQILDEALDAHHGQIDMLMQAVRGELTVGTIRYSIFEGRPHISMIEVLEDYRRQGIATQMLRYLQGQYPNEEIVWGYLTEDGSALYQAVVDEQPNPDYLRVQNDLEDITREFDAYVRRLDGGAILSPQEAADMDDLEDTQYRLEKELEELRPIRAFVRMGDGTAAEVPAVMGEATRTDLAPLREPPAAPQVAAHNFRFSEDYDLYPSGAKTKYKNNVMAIKLLKQIELEKRTATPEEQIILACYVGWGGLANAFSSTASGWENEYQELKSLLTDVEYKAAMNSTITAYYTEPDLIRHIYRALERFGFEGGPDRKILDPGMGTGNFYSVLPEQFQESKLFGVELDSITGRIAKQLYPDADISIMGYEATKFEDNSFDVILGNIPFNSVKIYDRRYNDLNPYIHDYFFIKSLDLAKPGGIIAFITSKGIMDRKDESLREYIARRAEFIGAIRLPNTAFKALAGTDVTADVVFLKKRAHPIELDRTNLPSWIETDLDRSKWIAYNRYFKDNPEMLMGEMVSSRNMYGNEDGTACVAPEDFDLNQHLTQAVDSLYARFTAEPDEEIEADEPEESNAEYEDAPAGTKNFTYVVRNGEIFFCEKDKLIPQPYTGMKAERIKGLCEIRTALLEVINIQSHEYDPLDLQKAQDTLNQVYDRFVAKYGAINSKGNILAFSDDDQFPLLRSIEDERKDKTGWDKSAIFTKATIRPFRQVNHADTAEDALQICLNHKLRVDLPYMSFLTGKEPEELVRELDTRIYLNPQKYYGNPLEGWELAEEYLSGHVRDKLLYARQKAAEEPELFARNVEALEEVQPEPLTPADIEVNMGAIWVPIEYYRQFMYETFQTSGYEKVIEGGDNRHRIDIEYFSYTTTWRVTNKNAEPDSVMVNQTFGTKRKNAYEIFEDCLNMQSSTVRDRQEYINENGNKSVKYVINAQETMIARAKQQQIQEAFASWVWKEPERRDTLLRIYNETFNTVRPREFDGSHLVFPGMNTEMKLRKHQLDFAARVIYTGTGLAAHEVGAGKTAALIAAGMYLKNLGAIHKAVFVVPNPLVGQWATEFYRFFPNANLLVSTAEDFTPKNRNRYISKIATGEYDAVILAHSQFEKIPISTERQIAMLERQINDIENAIYEIKSENGENWSVKQMVIFRKNLDERLKKLSAEEKKDNLLTFEQLGVDMMMVDEAHFFKNCFVFTKLRNVAGITTSSSQRAFDMLLKCQYLQETNQGRGVVFATGTPISNSISELFVMQRYLQPQELERFGWSYFDTWIAHFAKRTSVLELKPEGGGYRMRDRFVRFYNLPELMAVFREVADIKTADMLDIPGLPAVRTGKAEIVSVEATPAQQAIMADFIMRAEAIRTGRVKPEEDNMLKLTGEARLMAIDPRLIRPDADGTGSKLSVCIEDVYQVWKDTAASASTQLVFCDVGTPKAGKFNVYNEIRNVLLAKGVPESEIAFVHDATSEAQRQELFERTRQGKVRILIGSTSKLGTGVNVQNKVISIDHLDCPWKPSDITQRNGRGVRQGNENPEIMIKQFVAKGTFDAYLWQIQEQKLRYITQILTGKHIARSCEDVDETVLSAAQFKAAATDNPMVAQKMELENRVTELKILRGAWSNEQLSLERKISTIYPGQIKRYEKEIDQIGEDIKLLNQSAGSDFSIVLDGKRYTERSEAGEAFGLLYRMIKEGAKDDSEEFEIGAYRSFPLYLSVGYVSRLVLRYNHHYTTEVGTSALGAITRIEHLAERIPGYLKEAQRELEEVQKQLAVAQQQVGQPFIYEDELSEKVAQLTEINTKLEFESLQESEVILDENGQRSDGEEDWDSERVPSCASAEV